MGKKRILVFGALLVIGLAAVAYLAYGFLTAPAKDRPTLIYFRANL